MAPITKAVGRLAESDILAVDLNLRPQKVTDVD